MMKTVRSTQTARSRDRRRTPYQRIGAEGKQLVFYCLGNSHKLGFRMSTIIGYLVGQIGEFSGLRVAIPEKGLVIGRDPKQVDVVFDHSMVSRRHAQITPGKDGKLYLIDLQSQNGTHVNGRRITAPVVLTAGDKLDFGGEGKAIFVFESTDTTSVSGVLKEAFGETVAPVEWRPGDLIGRKLEVRATLGKGGFGVVYLVYDRETREMRALKTIRRELLADGDARNAFRREAILWVGLDEHPFVVTARWVDEFYGRLFVLMDFIAPDKQHRVNLSDHLAKASGPLDAGQALEWAVQFCLGMEHAVAHGIKCHRDIKPANILITQDGTLRISDFGLASAAEVAWHASKGIVDPMVTSSQDGGFGFSVLQTDGEARCGTPGYMPPEVYRGETADIRSDIYSFGLVLWQMATGSRIPPFLVPYRGDIAAFLREVYERQMTSRPPRISGPLWPVVKQCLKAKPAKRYSDFCELRDDLAAILRKRTGRAVRVPDASDQNVAFWNSKGASLNALGRHQEAINCYERALAIDPNHPTVWHNKGVALHFLHRHDEAIACYDKALSVNADYANAWNNKGKLLRVLGRNDEAVNCYDRALSIDARFAEGWDGKGDALYALGRHKEACGCYDKALAIDPRDPEFWYDKGRCLKALCRFEEAVVCYDKAVALDPQDRHSWYGKGKSLKALGRNEEAIDCFDKAVAIDPGFIEAWVSRGHVLGELGRHPEAAGCYDKALAVDPHDAASWSDKGIALVALGRHDKAADCYRKALAIDSRFAETWYLKGTCANAFDQPDEAIACFDRVLFIQPRNAEAWVGKASALNALRRCDESLNCYDKVLVIDPRNADAWFSKGIALNGLHRHEEAIGCFDKCLAIRPHNDLLWNWKGSALSALGRHEEAIVCYDKALVISPHHTAALYNKALAEDAVGKARAAVTSYLRFIELSPQGCADWVAHARQRLNELEN